MGDDDRLSELRREFENRLRWHFDVVAESGKDSAHIGLGISNALRDVERIVAEHVARARAEGAVEALRGHRVWVERIYQPGLVPKVIVMGDLAERANFLEAESGHNSEDGA